MRSIMFCKLNASRRLFPELQVAIYASSDQEVLILSYSDVSHCVPVHEAFFIHFSTRQRIQVGLLMLERLKKKEI